MEEFEINGIKYQKKPEPQRNHRRMPPMLMGMMMMAEMAMPGYYGGPKKQRELPHVNIIEEYGLIQQKKSNLSRSQREWVVRTFEKNFIIVPSAVEKI